MSSHADKSVEGNHPLQTEQIEALVRSAKQAGIVYLALFGSAARGEMGTDSDIDLAVRFGRRVTLLDLVDVQLSFQQLLGRPVDLIPVDDTYTFIRKSMEQDIIELFSVTNTFE